MIEYLCIEMLAKSIERSEIEPNRTPIVRLTFIGSVIEHNRAHPKLLPIEHNWTWEIEEFSNRTWSNFRKWKLQKLYTNQVSSRFTTGTQQAKELLLTNKLCVSFNWTWNTSIQGRCRREQRKRKTWNPFMKLTILEEMVIIKGYQGCSFAVCVDEQFIVEVGVQSYVNWQWRRRRPPSWTLQREPMPVL